MKEDQNFFNFIKSRDFSDVVSVFSYQQVTVTAKTDSGAGHPLQVDVRVQSLHVPETALQRALLREPRLQPGKRQRPNETARRTESPLFINLKLN